MVYLITIIFGYILPLAVCVGRGKAKKNVFIAKVGFIPLFGFFIMLLELEEMFNKWAEK